MPARLLLEMRGPNTVSLVLRCRMSESRRRCASEKFLPDDPRQFEEFFRKRAEGHAPGYDLAVYARPHQWMAIAKMIEASCPRAAWCAPVVDDRGPSVSRPHLSTLEK